MYLLDQSIQKWINSILKKVHWAGGAPCKLLQFGELHVVLRRRWRVVRAIHRLWVPSERCMWRVGELMAEHDDVIQVVSGRFYLPALTRGEGIGLKDRCLQTGGVVLAHVWGFVLAHICRIDHPESNAAVSDEISVKSTRKLMIFVIYETMFWIKVSVEYLIWFWKQKYCSRIVHLHYLKCRYKISSS